MFIVRHIQRNLNITKHHSPQLSNIIFKEFEGWTDHYYNRLYFHILFILSFQFQLFFWNSQKKNWWFHASNQFIYEQRGIFLRNKIRVKKKKEKQKEIEENSIQKEFRTNAAIVWLVLLRLVLSLLQKLDWKSKQDCIMLFQFHSNRDVVLIQINFNDFIHCVRTGIGAAFWISQKCYI